MNIDLSSKNLSASEKEGIIDLLSMQNPAITDDLKQIWYLMDYVWDQMGCDNKHLDWELIGRYYAHPVWLLNGLFIETHDISMQIRESIASYIANSGFTMICDYGGGFGTLAKEIAKATPNATIEIYEPYPSQYSKRCVAAFPNITFVDSLKPNCYDCLVSTDVLEHLENPLQTFKLMMDSIKPNGTALIGNCFYPVIKCHLPKNFHYRYSFNTFAKIMGTDYDGVIADTQYVHIFHKNKDIKLNVFVTIGGDKQMPIYPHRDRKESNAPKACA